MLPLKVETNKPECGQYLDALRAMVTMAGRWAVDPYVLAPRCVGIQQRHLREGTFRMRLMDGVKLVHRV